MARAPNIAETTKLQLTVAVATDRLIEEIAGIGLHGTTKSEVACSIIRMWLWDNQAKLRDSGIHIRPQK
jgi:hypothetical protein